MVQNVSGAGVRSLLAVSWIRTVIANMELSRTWWIVSWEGVEFKGKKDPQSFCRFRKQSIWRIQENSEARQKEIGVWSRASKQRCSFEGQHLKLWTGFSTVHRYLYYGPLPIPKPPGQFHSSRFREWTPKLNQGTRKAIFSFLRSTWFF